ncbi:uncharacterized protein LOC123295905 [Chrysoperla carnea]|uniref:uncharacterized protein LOC123295905 n=1 Tax=Chrysoperla carnea TaxID=189513 RepID=UPI001D087BF3|nr:uncharacterized protein LOC123295905 [Chrysoperla carnea]
MDIDSRGRLWILDVPKSNEVIPKILVYNTLTYTELLSCDLKNVLKDNLNTIIIDPVVNAFTGSRAYIGYSNENEILVYSLKEHRYWRLKFENENSPLNIFASYFAVSKREPILYLSGKSDERLFSVNLNILRKLNGPPAIIEPAFINVTYLGNKLGPSSGLISDFKGNIYYYLIRDYAVVRWNAKKSLQAENHKILMQSAEKLPFVTQFFAGPQYSIWAVTNNNTFINVTTTNEFNLFEKIIKIGTGF